MSAPINKNFLDEAKKMAEEEIAVFTVLIKRVAEHFGEPIAQHFKRHLSEAFTLGYLKGYSDYYTGISKKHIN